MLVELGQERQRHLADMETRLGYHQDLSRDVRDRDRALEALQDENVDLKLKVTNLESELLEERQRKEIRFDKTIEAFKFNI